MPWRRRQGRVRRRRRRTACRQTQALPTQERPKEIGSQVARSLLRSRELLLNLRRGGIGRALVVDPADFQIVALLAAHETELDVGVLRDRRTPVGNEYVFAVMFEGQLLDEMRRDDLALGVLDEAGIHRMLDQGLDFGGLAARSRPHANGRYHQNTPSNYHFAHDLVGNPGSTHRVVARGHAFPDHALQPPQPPTVTLTSLVAL